MNLFVWMLLAVGALLLYGGIEFLRWDHPQVKRFTWVTILGAVLAVAGLAVIGYSLHRLFI